ncbi:MAG: type II toxin-antitoxin system HicA family toxin [Chloroflexi bacterium]|nr:MAG: type II toxin-antitoxin system HicA family toxin [Chloroflexota bacterium]
MSKKHRAIYEAIFAKPNRLDIRWDDWITLLIFLGANIKNTAGSAVGVRLNGIYAVFHKPHPGSNIYPSDLKRIRKFLQEAGIQQVE